MCPSYSAGSECFARIRDTCAGRIGPVEPRHKAPLDEWEVRRVDRLGPNPFGARVNRKRGADSFGERPYVIHPELAAPGFDLPIGIHQSHMQRVPAIGQEEAIDGDPEAASGGPEMGRIDAAQGEPVLHHDPIVPFEPDLDASRGIACTLWQKPSHKSGSTRTSLRSISGFRS